MFILWRKIFDHVYGQNNSQILVKAEDDNLKESTAKGGFYINDELLFSNHTEIVEINIGRKNDKHVQNIYQTTFETLKYSDINDILLMDIVENVNCFFDLFLKLNMSLNFHNKFGVSTKSVGVAKRVIQNDLLNDLKEGISRQKSDMVIEEPIGETLFFYPLLVKLNEIASELT